METKGKNLLLRVKDFKTKKMGWMKSEELAITIAELVFEQLDKEK